MKHPNASSLLKTGKPGDTATYFFLSGASTSVTYEEMRHIEKEAHRHRWHPFSLTKEEFHLCRKKEQKVDLVDLILEGKDFND